MNQIRGLLGITLAFALGGCASLSESDCRKGDWYGIGTSDGRNGYTPNRLSHHDKACAKHGMGVNVHDYHADDRRNLRRTNTSPASTISRQISVCSP